MSFVIKPTATLQREAESRQEAFSSHIFDASTTMEWEEGRGGWEGESMNPYQLYSISTRIRISGESDTGMVSPMKNMAL